MQKYQKRFQVWISDLKSDVNQERRSGGKEETWSRTLRQRREVKPHIDQDKASMRQQTRRSQRTVANTIYYKHKIPNFVFKNIAFSQGWESRERFQPPGAFVFIGRPGVFIGLAAKRPRYGSSASNKDFTALLSTAVETDRDKLSCPSPRVWGRFVWTIADAGPVHAMRWNISRRNRLGRKTEQNGR